MPQLNITANRHHLATLPAPIRDELLRLAADQIDAEDHRLPWIPDLLIEARALQLLRALAAGPFTPPP